jgi:hypothetical protein
LEATRRGLEEQLLAEWDLSRRGEIAVRNSGSLSHIYFEVTDRQMDLSEVALLYPRLVDALVAHEGVGLVAGREGDQVVVIGPSGTLWIGPGGERLEGDHPLAGYGDPDWATAQVARLARFPHAGDLILLGTWDGESVISFEEQLASHGGLGGPQDWPFLAFPAGTTLAPWDIDNAEGVYRELTAVYGPESSHDAAPNR